MNGRTCQLCGKPLSRFTVGSGGDFCSREHRNQYRLRAGMDRLLEANKVANLMRRRENAKVIPASQLARDWKVLPRLAPVLRVPARPAALHLPGPPAPQFETLRIAAFSPNPIVPRRNGTAIRGAGRTLEPPHSFTGRKLAPLLPPRANRLPARIVPAGLVLPRLDGSRSADSRHRVASLGHNLRRAHLGANALHLRTIHSLAQEGPVVREPRRLNNSADRGRELRVSGGIGFRVPARRLRVVPFTLPRVEPPQRPPQFENMAAACLPKHVAVTLAEIRISIRDLLAPRIQRQHSAVRFQFPGPLAADALPARLAAGNPRNCGVPWAPPPPAPPELRHRNSAAPFHPAAPPLPFPSILQPRGLQSERRLSLVSFEAREAPFEMPPTALHGTLLSSMPFGAAPVRQVETPPATLEEHFDGGLKNWAGAIDDWKVDIAGVRPGSLALYSPSLELHDYLVEFLTRVENRGVTWVFRAADFQNYYQATLAVSPEGGYEFRRTAVIAGAAEPPVVHPVPAGPSGKTAVTLRTRVSHNEFTVFLDGRPVDTWTDSRLAAGGIGFVAAPEDRVRLYWVKVSPAGHLSKEYSKP